MTSTPEMQRRARLERKKMNAKSKVEQIIEALKKKESIPSICKRLIVTPQTIEKLALLNKGAKILKLKITKGSRHTKGKK